MNKATPSAAVVFFDVDTQIDFLYPSGALYVPGAEAIVDRVAALNHWAARHGIPVISSMDAHTPGDLEFRDWPPHCIAGTPGQRKPPSTLLEKRVVVPNTPGLPETGAAEQILLEKQSLDCFTNVNLKALLHRLGAERYVVYGVVTEICVKFAAFGLLKTGRRVELVRDAVKDLDPAAGAKTIADLTAAGGTLTTSEQILAQV
jgi:nicotinamidase/pyrazinamidase